MMMSDQRFASITEVSELIRQKQMSPVELVRDALKRIEELNPKLNAFITILADQSLEEAQNAEADIKNGWFQANLWLMSTSKEKDDYRLACATTKKPNLGIVKNFTATDEVRAAFLRAVETLQAVGYTIQETVHLAYPSFDFTQIDADCQTVSHTLFQQSDV